jgi:NADH dehydrogenase FAD-containing subunit
MAKELAFSRNVMAARATVQRALYQKIAKKFSRGGRAFMLGGMGPTGVEMAGVPRI